MEVIRFDWGRYLKMGKPMKNCSDISRRKRGRNGRSWVDGQVREKEQELLTIIWIRYNEKTFTFQLMDSLYLKGFESPIDSWETERFIRELSLWNQGELIIVKWRTAKVTAVHDDRWNVFMLSLNPVVIEGSIPVDDSHNPPAPRSSIFFRSPLLQEEKIGEITGIAAYKFIDTPWVVETHETRATAVLAQ